MTAQPPSHFARAVSLLQTGPRGLFYRFFDQLARKWTGAPYWGVTRITPQLYVGGQHYAKGWHLMQTEGIEAVVNLREAHYDDTEKGVCGAHHLHLPTRDNTPPTMEDLMAGARFIADQVAQGRKVYIHCGVGVGRAPTQAAAYLITTGMSAKEAVKTIKRVRPFIHMTPRQHAQLEAFALQWQTEKDHHELNSPRHP